MQSRLAVLFFSLSLAEKLRLPNSALLISPGELLLVEDNEDRILNLRKAVVGMLAACEQTANQWVDDTADPKSAYYTEWAEFLDLLLGFKAKVKASEEAKLKAARIKAEINKLENRLKTPEQRLAELKAQLGDTE